MKYQLLVFDFDGTVRPTGEERITRPPKAKNARNLPRMP